MSVASKVSRAKILIPQMHAGQVAAFRVLRAHQFKVLRCGRRLAKPTSLRSGSPTGLHGVWNAHGLPLNITPGLRFTRRCTTCFGRFVEQASRNPPVLRLMNGGRLDFWTLANDIAGRGRRYDRVVIDEAAFGKGGGNAMDDSTMASWEKGIKPTLYDRNGEALVCSNSAGKDPDNFFYNVCTDPEYGFTEYHATTLDNPILPMRLSRPSPSAWAERRKQVLADLITDNDPLVYKQEYLADFVDWSGVAFFSREKLLDQNQPVGYPEHCDTVFAVIDTASKTGTDNDGTAVTFFALDQQGRFLL